MDAITKMISTIDADRPYSNTTLDNRRGSISVVLLLFDYTSYAARGLMASLAAAI